MKHDSKNIYEVIKALFQSKLTPPQEQKLNELLQDDADALRLIQNEQVLHNFVLETEMAEVKNDLEQFMHNQEKPNYTKIIVASIAGIIFLGTIIYFFFAPNTVKNETQKPVFTEEKIVPVTNKDNKKEINDLKPTKQESALEQKQDIIESTSKHIVEINENPKAQDELSLPLTDSSEHAEISKRVSIQEYLPEFTKDEKTHIEEKKDICADFNPDVNVEIQEMELTDKYATVAVNGSDNLEYKILPERSYSTDSYYELEPGQYAVFARDESGCETKVKEFSIQKTYCAKEYTKVFSPHRGDAWNVPVAIDEEYSVKIINKDYKEVFMYNSSSEDEPIWNGTDTEGNNVPLGLYKVFISYENGEKCVLNITIIR